MKLNDIVRKEYFRQKLINAIPEIEKIRRGEIKALKNEEALEFLKSL